MVIGNLSINEAFFKGWTFKQFKGYFESAKFADSSGITAEQMAKLLGIEVPKEK